MSLMVTNVRYDPDNTYVTGYGAFMMSRGVERVALSWANVIERQIRLTARLTEPLAPRYAIQPGHISATYRKTRIMPRTVILISGGRANKRRGARIYLSTDYKKPIRDEEGNVIGTRSGAVTLEFGSRYNEGAPMDRPALHVMARAARASARRHLPLKLPRGSRIRRFS